MAVSDIFNSLTFATSAALLGVAAKLLHRVDFSDKRDKYLMVSLSFVVAFAAATHLWSYTSFIVPTFFPREAFTRRTRGLALGALIALGLGSMINFTIQSSGIAWGLWYDDFYPNQRMYESIKAIFDGTEQPPVNGPGGDWQKRRFMSIVWPAWSQARGAAANEAMDRELAYGTYVVGWLLMLFLVINLLFIIVPAKIRVRSKQNGLEIVWASGRIVLPEDDAADSQAAALRSGEHA